MRRVPLRAERFNELIEKRAEQWQGRKAGMGPWQQLDEHRDLLEQVAATVRAELCEVLS